MHEFKIILNEIFKYIYRTVKLHHYLFIFIIRFLILVSANVSLG
jgi:hypothetical protein